MQPWIRTPGPAHALFDSFIVSGFECSDHRLDNGRRLDLLASTSHDRFADGDYARLRALGIRASREGASWPRTEHAGEHDFTSLLPRIKAARCHGVQICWDLMHFGWPDDVDVFAPSFPIRLGRYARALATFLANEGDGPWMFTPVNEMSFLAWAGGDIGIMNPFAMARGVELKAQLTLATIEAIEAIRAVLPEARFLQPEPAVAIVPDAHLPQTWRRVACDNLLQYQAWDMLSGRVWPSLGGDDKYLDIIGVNFYPDNQFTLDGRTVRRPDHDYRPFSTMLGDVWKRYGRPMMVSETGSEGDQRAPWLRYVADECALAMRAGCELHGLTLYPILNHPGWVDDRHCHNGLWDYADDEGERAAFEPLAEEVQAQEPRLVAERSAMLAGRSIHTVTATGAAS